MPTSTTEAVLALPFAIAMPSNFWFRSWRWYEAIIEMVFVGTYLYAIFVLTSTQFLNNDIAMEYATVMAVPLSLTSSKIRNYIKGRPWRTD